MVESKETYSQLAMDLQSADWGHSERPITPYSHRAKGKRISHIGSHKPIWFQEQQKVFGNNQNELTSLMGKEVTEVGVVAKLFDLPTIQEYKNRNKQIRPGWAELYREQSCSYQEQEEDYTGELATVYKIDSQYTWFEKELKDNTVDKPVLVYRFTNPKRICTRVGLVKLGEEDGTLDIRVERKISHNKWCVVNQLTLKSDFVNKFKGLLKTHKDVDIVKIILSD
jgi:hypothetical protein